MSEFVKAPVSGVDGVDTLGAGESAGCAQIMTLNRKDAKKGF